MPEPSALREELIAALRELQEPEFLTVAEAAKVVRKSPAWLYGQIAAGKLAHIRHGRQDLTIWRPHLREFMLANLRPAEKPTASMDQREARQIVRKVMGG